MRKPVSVITSVILASSLCVPSIGSAYAGVSDAADIIAAAKEAGVPTFAGSAIVAKYLDGNPVTYDELLTIDMVALKAWNENVFTLISTLKESLAPAEGGTEDPSNPSEGSGSDGSDGSEEGGEIQVPGAGEGSSSGEAISPAPGEGAASSSPDQAAAADEAAIVETVASSQNPFDASITYPKWSYAGNTSFEMPYFTEDIDAQKLIAAIGEPAREVAQVYGVSASEMIALAITKSYSGKNFAAEAPYRNLFMATGYTTTDTTVYDEFGNIDYGFPRVGYEFDSQLCEYATYKECLEDHAYRVANGIEPAVPDDGTWGGAEGSLTKRVQKAIEDYDLERYDVPLDYQTATPLVISAWDEATSQEVQYEVSLADLVSNVTSYLGVDYVWGGTTPDGFDCSGLVQYAYQHALQMSIPRTTYYQCLHGEDVDFADLHMGDMLFFTKDGIAGHVAMYLGEGCYIEAPQPGEQVKITTMDEKKPAFAKRLIHTVPVQE